MRRSFRRSSMLDVALLFSASLIAMTTIACGESGSPLLPSPTPVGSSIHMISGNNQAGTIGTALANPLVVQVNDANGHPIPNVTVRWQVIDGGGTLSRDTTPTDASGRSQVIWTLGTTAGTGDVTAVIGALATQTVEFTARALLKQ
jgi:hypothetical protein